MTDPRHTAIARSYLGVREIVGPKNSPTIMGWVKRLGVKILGTVVNDDEMAWCGTFQAECMVEAGYKTPPIAVRAKAWASWGIACAPQVGAVGVKSRVGGGHVFQIVGITADGHWYKALGGNQGNCVSITDVAVADVTDIRWPSEIPQAHIPLPIMARGTVVSEA
jgi:uncharacterized protein (TIGR02594 family)